MKTPLSVRLRFHPAWRIVEVLGGLVATMASGTSGRFGMAAFYSIFRKPITSNILLTLAVAVVSLFAAILCAHLAWGMWFPVGTRMPVSKFGLQATSLTLFVVGMWVAMIFAPVPGAVTSAFVGLSAVAFVGSDEQKHRRRSP